MVIMKRTGWPQELLQDDSRELSRWFASRIDARRCVRDKVEEIEMLQLRWIVPVGTSTKLPVLQVRHGFALDASGALCPGEFSEWADVPAYPMTPTEQAEREGPTP